MMVRLFDKPTDQNPDGLGDYEFEVLPRHNEKVVLYLHGGETQWWVVTDVRHHFIDHTKNPQVALMVRRADA
jgi:hypothetical protein